MTDTTPIGKNSSEVSEGERPDDCNCWNASNELPCEPCYVAGFDDPNPETPGADDSRDSR